MGNGHLSQLRINLPMHCDDNSVDGINLTGVFMVCDSICVFCSHPPFQETSGLGMLRVLNAGLSFPMTLLWCIRRTVALQMLPRTLLEASHIRIVAAGCTHRLEQRILQESNYFHELASYFPSSYLQLCMVGPEMKAVSSKSKQGSTKKAPKSLAWVHGSERFSWCVQRSTVRKFLQVCCQAAVAC